MSKGVLTTKVHPAYDDIPEERYHFPKTYLKQVKETVGDWTRSESGISLILHKCS